MTDTMSMVFEKKHVPWYPLRTYWQVTCSCGRHSNRLIEPDAKWWAADHMKQHQLGGRDG